MGDSSVLGMMEGGLEGEEGRRGEGRMAFSRRGFEPDWVRIILRGSVLVVLCEERARGSRAASFFGSRGLSIERELGEGSLG